jgi:hypothetical protein
MPQARRLFALAALTLPTACSSYTGPFIRDIRPLGGGVVEIERCTLRFESGRYRDDGNDACTTERLNLNEPAPPRSGTRKPSDSDR